MWRATTGLFSRLAGIGAQDLERVIATPDEADLKQRHDRACKGRAKVVGRDAGLGQDRGEALALLHPVPDGDVLEYRARNG